MKKSVMLFLSVLGSLLQTGLAEDEVSILNDKGEEVGPLLLKPGTAIMLGDQTYKVGKIITSTDKCQKPVEETVLPSVDFNDTPLKQIPVILSRVYRESRGQDKCDLNFLYVPPATTVTNHVSAATVQPDPQNITLSLKNVTLKTVLQTLHVLAGTRHMLNGNVVMLFAPNALEMSTRTFVPSRDLLNPPMSAEVVKQWLADRGDVTWPEGSGAVLLASKMQSGLEVVNTEENLRRIEKVMRSEFQTKLVDVEALVIEFSTGDVDKLAKKGHLDVESLYKLWVDSRGKLLASPRIMTKCGQEAVINSLTTYWYLQPQYRDPDDGEDQQTGLRFPSSPQLSGMAFESQDAGNVMSVTASLSEGGLIELSFAGILAHKPEWKEHAAAYEEKGVVKSVIRYKQPERGADNIMTRLTLKDGEMALVGGGLKDQSGKNVVYTMVRASKIDLLK